MRDDARAPGDDGLRALAREWRRAVPEAADAGDDWAAVVAAAVRELASLFTVQAGSGGWPGTPLSAATRDLIWRPGGSARYQALAMLAGAVWWLSRECGHPEGEILGELASAPGRLEVPPGATRNEATRRAASGAVRAAGDTGARVAAAIRELLSCAPVPGGSPGRPDAAAPGSPQALPAVTGLVRDPPVQAQYLALAMLAAIVTRSSRDSGRPEAETLDGLAASFRPGA